MVHVPVGIPMTILGNAMLLGIALNTCDKVCDKVATCGVVVGALLSLVNVVVVGVAVVACC